MTLRGVGPRGSASFFLVRGGVRTSLGNEVERLQGFTQDLRRECVGCLRPGKMRGVPLGFHKGSSGKVGAFSVADLTAVSGDRIAKLTHVSTQRPVFAKKTVGAFIVANQDPTGNLSHTGQGCWRL